MLGCCAKGALTVWSRQSIEKYRQDGYLIRREPIFDAKQMVRLTEIFEEHLANRGAKRADELDTPHFADHRLLEFLLSDRVLDLVEPLIGPNIALWSSHFIAKEAYQGRRTPWHEDSAYWQGRVDRVDQIVTVWLALDASTRENGCMRVIPGSHRGGHYVYGPVDTEQNTFTTEIQNVDEARAVYFELQPGQCSLHDARIIHGALANQSDHRRAGYTMRYMATTTHVIAEANPNFPIWLARGRDLAGNTYANG